jgi:hypothetical protein
VRVIAELKQRKSEKNNAELLKFAGHAREVFTSQPLRRFIHGFITCGSLVELWVFDRSGLYSCQEFDIHEDPRRFIRVMASYTMMSDEELGMDTYIQEDDDGKYIMFKGEAWRRRERLYLEREPIASQRAIVCRGTTCYRAKKKRSKEWEFVVKFSWRAAERPAEGKLLEMAKENKVWGVAEVIGHLDLQAINDVRQGMTLGKANMFRSARGSTFSNIQSRTSDLSLKENRKRPGETSHRPAKRLRTKGGSKLRDITNQVNAEEDSGPRDDDGPREANKDNIEPPSGSKPSSDNRILSCLVVSPPGRPISNFESVKEFLEALRDIIKAHRSLYIDGKILHRDISENNVIITEAKNGGPRGMLIDLDLAKQLGSGASGARYRTGTMEFMAIGVLEGEERTYRHDLESIFYVFLWTIIYPAPPAGSAGTKQTSRLV